jgi:nucleotide-binding universal stress UspA family protein
MYRSILLPVDLDQESSWKKALPLALRLCETFGADLHLLTIVPDVSHSYVAQYFPLGYEQQITGQTRTRLEAFAHEQAGTIGVGLHVGHGRVYDEILRAAERLGCDLIVMASHRPGAADYLIGPNAARVVSHSDRSVLVVRD